MKRSIIITLIFVCFSKLFSQESKTITYPKYWEDQLYLNVTYNILENQPSSLAPSDVSYGISLGYIKDIPLNKKNTFALGIGTGYTYDSFSHSLIVNDSFNYTTSDDVSNNKLKTHNIAFPIQIRWRTSDATTYSFWRIYAGARLSYNLYNKHTYIINDIDYTYTDLNSYRKFQTALELSVGYGAFNLYTQYNLNSLYENAFIDDVSIETRIFKVGLIFYLL